MRLTCTVTGLGQYYLSDDGGTSWTRIDPTEATTLMELGTVLELR